MKINNFPHALAFRLDDATLDKVSVAAAAHGETIGAFARRVVCTAVDAAVAPPRVKGAIANADVIRQLTGELGRHGSLLNQIARSLHMKSDPQATAALTGMQHSYELTLKSLRLALAGDSSL
jgi:plasmid stability protein